MTLSSKGRIRHKAWRIFLFQMGLSATVVVLALLPALFFENRYYSLVALLVAAGGVLGLSFYCASRLMRLMEDAHDKITTLTTHDDLTGLPNRRWFFERLDEEVDRALRYDSKLSLIMVDIDHFRKVNDTFGHPLGDLALAEVARLLAANIRTSDIVVRYGGEEFMIIIPESDAEQAAVVAEKLRVVIEVNDISLEGPQIQVTISCGVADLKSVRPGKGSIRDALVLAADHSMHRAKENGRNQVLIHIPKNDKHLPLV
ncbi:MULTISPECIES: GGDEF domain-containing protein [unclassified Pseudodesulfovibrio]|uniref:GGDEF domain-containing protein n=1 Tax=unclassified Pseudodesulfovibrio TaxID=2661612 RepID=UPI000FEB718A|nr:MULTISPECIES: GGDEF domain-containing protein [unclassified Pseudodesulfovibrio]MCJ2165390.1 GGDEF domain-containing protein [Pseudodesulfovibrio sp. S3-i]RWU02237.1 GGDEF domain-containing protein [Pseudodesulfovibrio sp. S3]